MDTLTRTEPDPEVVDPGGHTPESADESSHGFAASFEIRDDPEAMKRRGRLRRGRPQQVPRRYVLQNRTPYRITIEHDDWRTYGELVLPPLAERVVAGSRLKPFEDRLRIHRQRHEVSVRPYRQERTSVGATVAVVVVPLLVLAVAVHHLLTYGTLQTPLMTVGVLVLVAGVCLSLLRAHRRERRRRLAAVNTDSAEGDIATGVSAAYLDGNETTRRGMHMLVLALIVTIACVLPSIAIIAATDARTFLDFDGGLRVKPEQVSRFTSRVVQMIYVSILSIFPALMYFQFDRQRVGTIWGQWIRSIFRMDGRMRTLADVHARYGDDLVEASNSSTKTVRLMGGNHSPIVVATTLIALGWTVLVLQTESFDFSAVSSVNRLAQVAEDASDRADEAAAQAAGAVTTEEAEAAAAAAQSALADAEAANAEASAVVAESSGAPPGEVGQSDGGSGESDGSDAGSGAGTGDPSGGSLVDGGGSSGPASDGGGSGGSASDGGGSGGSASEDAAEAAAQAQVSAEQASTKAAEVGAAPTQLLSTKFFQLLVKQPSAAAMAFLGAYFFAVYLILRSYFRGDLRPKLYNQITARLVTVVVVAYLINVMLLDTDRTVVWSLAFLAGVVPRTAVQWVMQLGSRGFDKVFNQSKSLGSRQPLTLLDGVDLYDASVLEAEGVHDIPSLANSDLVAVMLNSRVPTGRLVDWADQAALMVIVNEDDDESIDERMTNLRKIGIRTGSDLVAACRSKSEHERSCVADALRRDGDTATGAMTPCMAAAALERLPVWPRVVAWRKSPLAALDAALPLPPPSADLPSSTVQTPDPALLDAMSSTNGH